MKFKFNRQILAWLIIILIAIFLRFYNYANFLYFINDQGRDALKLKSIVEGDLTLIGPTSGLPGFFLGPLWYYIGLPGYMLSDGSPHGIALWYIFLATLAIPFFILIVKKLLPKEQIWQYLGFGFLVFLPASLNGATFIWNPLLSIPLMAAALYFLFAARSSRLALFLAFLMLALVLHSEFAYGIFLLPILFILIFWIRKKFALLDYVIAASAIIITLLPQILFEVKNNFLMSKSLIQGVISGETAVSLFALWTRRPSQLFSSTQELFFGRSSAAFIPMLLVGAFIIYGMHQAFKKKNYEWQIIALIGVIPYIGYMFWKGNYGNFFSYYITPHFIPLALIFIYGLKNFFAQQKNKNASYLLGALIGLILAFSLNNAYASTLKPDNEAGLRTILSANRKVLDYQIADQQAVALTTGTSYSSSVLTFTPNYLTAQYDFAMQWLAKELNLPIPNTELRPTDQMVYIIVEPDREIPEKRFLPWYQKITENRVRLRKEKIGILLLETWANADFALQNQLAIYQENITEKMCW